MTPSAMHGRALHHNAKRANDTCMTGGFIKTPTQGQQVNVTQPVVIEWEPSCLNGTTADIWLYKPASTGRGLHEWVGVNIASGQQSVNLEPKWWNVTNTSTVQLQFTIVPHGTPPFLGLLPAGPIFNAVYVAPKDGSIPDIANPNKQDPDVTNASGTQKHKSSKGGVAAAVLMPLILVGLLAAGWYLKKSRARKSQKSKRFTEAVDRRMSTISTDWKSITTAGAQAAIRQSMVGGPPGNRLSSFSFGNIRPSSTVAVEGDDQDAEEAPAMAQRRPNPRTSAYTERTSRAISFADDPRPSMSSRKNVTSRAFHTAIIPPLPTRQDSTTGGDLSPTQTSGPLSLSPEDIHLRLSGTSSQVRPSMDEVYPALQLMRNGGDSSTADDAFFEAPHMPAPPSASLTAPASPPAQLERSPIMGMMPMQAMPANVMSPDEMLRAYAERSRTGAPSLSPPPTAASASSGMRVLYSPPSAENSLSVGSPFNGPGVRASAVSEMSRYDDDEDAAPVYHATAQ